VQAVLGRLDAQILSEGRGPTLELLVRFQRHHADLGVPPPLDDNARLLVDPEFAIRLLLLREAARIALLDVGQVLGSQQQRAELRGGKAMAVSIWGNSALSALVFRPPTWTVTTLFGAQAHTVSPDLPAASEPLTLVRSTWPFLCSNSVSEALGSALPLATVSSIMRPFVALRQDMVVPDLGRESAVKPGGMFNVVPSGAV